MGKWLDSVRCGALGLCAAAVLAGPGTARAAQDWTAGLRLTVEERYDDALRLDMGSSQLATKLVPQVGLDVRSRTVELGGWYAADLLHQYGSGRLSWDHRGQLGLQAQLSPHVQVDGALAVWKVTDPLSLPRLSVPRTLSPTLYARAGAGAHLRAGERWRAGFRYAFEVTRVEDGSSAPGFVHVPSAEAWYRLSRLTEVGLEARVQRFAFGVEDGWSGGASAALRHRFTREVHGTLRAGAGLYRGRDDPGARPFPRMHLELAREGERVNLAISAGHDLVGASGSAAALWSDHGSVHVEWRIAGPLRLYGTASAYRTGRAPDAGYWPPGSPETLHGYGLTAGVAWRLGRALTLQLGGDRHAELGRGGDGVPDLSRSVLSARVVLTPFDWAPGRGW